MKDFFTPRFIVYVGEDGKDYSSSQAALRTFGIDASTGIAEWVDCTAVGDTVQRMVLGCFNVAPMDFTPAYFAREIGDTR